MKLIRDIEKGNTAAPPEKCASGSHYKYVISCFLQARRAAYQPLATAVPSMEEPQRKRISLASYAFSKGKTQGNGEAQQVAIQPKVSSFAERD